MASGAAGGAEAPPPALPVKQHRSRSFGRSSVESDCVMLSPVGLQHQSCTFNDVFPEPTDCHADQCPIHQRYDPRRHQERFFSAGTPPPVPKKRLARTFSLPGTEGSPLCPWSPASPLRRHPQNFDNPLYMLAPAPDRCFHQETEEVAPASTSPAPSLSFSQLTFDTLDEHLPYLFSSFDDQGAVSRGIQHRHLLFLRSMAQSIEAGILLPGEATGEDVCSYQPPDFLLAEGSQPRQIGGRVYYKLHSPRFPGRALSLKVHRQQADETPLPPTQRQLSHVNVQNAVAHFTPSRAPENESSMSRTRDPSALVKSECTAAAKPPGGGSTGCSTDPTLINVTSVQCLLQRGHSVSVERDLPHVSLEDFVQEGGSLQSSDRLVYDRQVCVLLLQILMGAQHLYNTGAADAAELRPQEIFLVWPGGEGDEGGNSPEQGAASETRRRFKAGRLKKGAEWGKGRIQMLWRIHGSPRVVLSPQCSPLSASHPVSSMKCQIGNLLQYCLAPHPSAASLDPGLYRRGLLHLTSLLQNGGSGPQMADTVALLQVLLWGPRGPLFNHRGPATAAVHNWLTVKRALLVMKLAERGLIAGQSALGWEEYMCLQYLSFTDPEAVEGVIGQLVDNVLSD